jgi:hypothetical protein
MNVNNLHALIVLRNHAQSILNGARADLKLTKEEKSSLTNGLKKVDEVFIKNFETCVEASNTSSKVRSWTSTESEESVLLGAMSLVNTVASVHPEALTDEIKKDIHHVAELVGVLPKTSNHKDGLFSRVDATEQRDRLVAAAVKGLGTESVIAEDKASEVVTVPVVTTKDKADKKAKRGPKKA